MFDWKPHLCEAFFVYRMNEQSRRVKVWETFKRENRKADGLAFVSVSCTVYLNY